jgi:hypothetical protein
VYRVDDDGHIYGGWGVGGVATMTKPAALAARRLRLDPPIQLDNVQPFGHNRVIGLGGVCSPPIH